MLVLIFSDGCSSTCAEFSHAHRLSSRVSFFGRPRFGEGCRRNQIRKVAKWYCGSSTTSPTTSGKTERHGKMPCPTFISTLLVSTVRLTGFAALSQLREIRSWTYRSRVYLGCEKLIQRPIRQQSCKGDTVVCSPERRIAPRQKRSDFRPRRPCLQRLILARLHRC